MRWDSRVRGVAGSNPGEGAQPADDAGAPSAEALERARRSFAGRRSPRSELARWTGSDSTGGHFVATELSIHVHSTVLDGVRNLVVAVLPPRARRVEVDLIGSDEPLVLWSEADGSLLTAISDVAPFRLRVPSAQAGAGEVATPWLS